MRPRDARSRRGYARRVKETIERELKLTPGEGFVLPELGGEPQPTRVFLSTYHDTRDLVLARHGVTLRHRVEEGTGLWQLKLPRGAARAELEQAGPPARPPLELSSLLVAFVRGTELAPDRPAAYAPGSRPCRRCRGRRRLRLRARGPARHPALPRARDRARRRRRADASPPRGGASAGGRRAARAAAEALSRARSRGAARHRERALRNAASRRSRHVARRAGQATPAARPRRSARLRPRGSPPAPRRDPPPARIPPRRARARRQQMVGAASRRGRLAREGARSRTGPRRADRPAHG